jgi:hypothetical protein
MGGFLYKIYKLLNDELLFWIHEKKDPGWGLFFMKWRPLIDVIRTDFRQDVEKLYSMIPSETKEWLKAVVDGASQTSCKAA